MKKGNLNKGITLIALIITIIVLLILAGIVLAMVVGDNGILAKAGTAKTRTNESQAAEENKLSDYEEKINTLGRTFNGKFNNLSNDSYEQFQRSDVTFSAGTTGSLLSGTSKFGTINENGELVFNQEGLYYISVNIFINSIGSSGSQIYTDIFVNDKLIDKSFLQGTTATAGGNGIFYAKEGDKLKCIYTIYNNWLHSHDTNISIYKII